MAHETPTFYKHPQSIAIASFLPILRPHLPHSNNLYNRLQAPHNTPARHCLIAATFPPPVEGSPPVVPPEYTIFFSDRSRHVESQVWVFNSLITKNTLSQVQQETLTAHIKAAILFLRDTEIPEAPGWPFSPIIRFACLHEHLTSSMKKVAGEAVIYSTDWNAWVVSTSSSALDKKGRRALPDGFTVGRVPEDQLDIVLSTSTIVRQASTMLLLPNVGLLNGEGLLVAWAYIGIDGSFATLYVLPEYRGHGLASFVAVELLRRLGRGEFGDLGYDGKSGWVHSDVHDGNRESEGVMKSLGGKCEWVTSYLRVDTEKYKES